MIRKFNQHSPWATGTLDIINEFVTGNILFLEQTDINVPHQQWAENLDKIKLLVETEQIETILIDIGLDMFEDYIPCRNWDNVVDPKLRMEKIVQFLDQLLSSPTAEQDILSMHTQMHSRLIKNKEYFHSQHFRDLLTQQLHLINA
jgi:hypothetical protein